MGLPRQCGKETYGYPFNLAGQESGVCEIAKVHYQNLLVRPNCIKEKTDTGLLRNTCLKNVKTDIRYKVILVHILLFIHFYFFKTSLW